MSLPLLQLMRGVCGNKIDQPERFRTTHLYLAHMAHIEQPDGAADSIMLRKDAGVLDGHFPAAEIDHFRARLTMNSMQRGRAKCGGLGHENLILAVRTFTATESRGSGCARVAIDITCPGKVSHIIRVNFVNSTCPVKRWFPANRRQKP